MLAASGNERDGVPEVPDPRLDDTPWPPRYGDLKVRFRGGMVSAADGSAVVAVETPHRLRVVGVGWAVLHPRHPGVAAGEPAVHRARAPCFLVVDPDEDVAGFDAPHAGRSRVDGLSVTHTAIIEHTFG